MGRQVVASLMIMGVIIGTVASFDSPADASDGGVGPGLLTHETYAGVWGDTIVAVADHEGELWRVTADGVVTAPDGGFFGDMSEYDLNSPIVGMEMTATGNGYWLLGRDGGVFSFGDASFHGSTGNLKLNRPVRGLAAHPDGNGYWFVATDGGIFAFGSIGFHGSAGGIALNQPIVGMTETSSGNGYWMVAEDGGIFAYGDALFYGSLGGTDVGADIIGLAVTPGGAGYWIFDSLGGVHEFGDATNIGDATGSFDSPVVGSVPVVVDDEATGFWMVLEDGSVYLVTTTDVEERYNGESPPPAGSYSWLISATNPDGTPIRWNGCAPIPYWTDLSQGPAGSQAALDDVIARIEAASGYDLVFQGTTSQLASEFMSDDDYGLLIRFSTTAQEPGMSGGAIGLGGLSAAAVWDEGWHYFGAKGTVQLLSTFSFTDGWGKSNSMQEVLAHEIGHALNLGHVDLTSEVMYGSAIGVGDLGDGTSYALRTAADAPCKPNAISAAGAQADAPNDIRVMVPVGPRQEDHGADLVDDDDEDDDDSEPLDQCQHCVLGGGVDTHTHDHYEEVATIVMEID